MRGPTRFLPLKRSLALALLTAAFTSCWKPEHVDVAPPTPVPSPSSTPEASPTPIYIPQKRLDTAKLFNGIELHTTIDTEPGSTATTERNTGGSYALDLKLRVKVPKANSELRELAALNPALPQVLPGLEALLPNAKVPPFFEAFYRFKLATLQQNLPRLDLLLSRHNFYDCETMLALEHPQSKRRALLIQADMDIDTDGSDGDRVVPIDTDSPTFQSMTSYKWPKKTTVANPLLAAREAKLKEAEALAGRSPGREQRDQIGALRYEVSQLATNSFLVANADPYIVLPGWMLGQSGQPFSPRVGDYAVVIFNSTLYPAIIGDVGPRDKIGEASLRVGREINAKATADNRPVSALKITYLVFPETADKPFTAPDLEKWRAHCEQLLSELGGHAGELHTWPDVTTPASTPTPSPSPSPEPSASPSASPSQ
ncbi:MAG: hypothetical protein QOD99_1429 [Chthoniobacter sp.]|nr:hypothetical protein [Chthoniobacter sp.]